MGAQRTHRFGKTMQGGLGRWPRFAPWAPLREPDGARNWRLSHPEHILTTCPAGRVTRCGPWPLPCATCRRAGRGRGQGAFPSPGPVPAAPPAASCPSGCPASPCRAERKLPGDVGVFTPVSFSPCQCHTCGHQPRRPGARTMAPDHLTMAVLNCGRGRGPSAAPAAPWAR